MTTLIEWATPKKIAQDSGVSRRYVIMLLETGQVKYSKNGKRKNAGIMVSIPSFNKFWERNGIVK